VHNGAAGVRLKTNGGLYKLENGIETFLNWYITPNSAQSSLDEVRITSVTGDTLSYQSQSNDLWIAIDQTISYYNSDSNPAAGGAKSTTFTLELRYNGGSVLDSAVYTVSADYETV
jgi:phospholipase/lecithinase/hemolysin